MVSRQFVDWSGGAKAKILVITWATASPAESFEGMRKQLAEFPGSVEHAPDPPFDSAKKAQLMQQLSSASGVFFGGGDQNRIADVLGDREIFDKMRALYRKGVAFGGTSAGAAVLSDPMMTGEADLKVLDGGKVGVRQGLGFIPNVIFDQHFLVRQRHNRLFGLLMKNPSSVGVGIDEDNAVLIEDEQFVRVVGTTWVMFVDASGKNGMVVNFARPGESYDLKKRRLIKH